MFRYREETSPTRTSKNSPASCIRRYPWLPEGIVRRYVRHYGTEIHGLLAECGSIADLGEHFGADLHAVEVEFLVEHEWAGTPEDILWRRTKQGLHMPDSGVNRLREWLDAARGASRAGCVRY